MYWVLLCLNISPLLLKGDEYPEEKSEAHQELDVQIVQIPDRAPNPEPPHSVDLPESFSYSPPGSPDEEEPTIVIGELFVLFNWNTIDFNE